MTFCAYAGTIGWTCKVTAREVALCLALADCLARGQRGQSRGSPRFL